MSAVRVRNLTDKKRWPAEKSLYLSLHSSLATTSATSSASSDELSDELSDDFRDEFSEKQLLIPLRAGKA